MDKQTFYSELSARLVSMGLSQEQIKRNTDQFDNYFNGKTDDDISIEISKLGDLDRVAARIKRMTIKASEPQKEQQKEEIKEPEQNPDFNEENVPDDEGVVYENTANSNGNIDNPPSDFDDDMQIANEKFSSREIKADNFDNDGFEYGGEAHGTKRGSLQASSDIKKSLAESKLDTETVLKNRRKFWIIFIATLPITLSILAATAAAFALVFFMIAVVILISVGVLALLTAGGTLISVFGLIFGASQMFASLPVGLYECGIAICMGSIALFVGILVYNFAVRLMPFAAKWLLVFMKYVTRKYRELYVYLKKECIGL